MKVRTEVLGAEHVARAQARMTPLHVRASKNTGVDPKEIAEALMHVAVYAGVPAANSAVALAKTILAPDSGEQ
jgi:alkylhydroperoxidase/carboxymuconolactone decarboxylase family protein YurZ